MSGRKEPTMNEDNSKGRPAPRAVPPWSAAVALALACVGAIASPVAAGRTGVAAVGTSPEVRRVRSKAWWLDFWSHSMQEEAFVAWMTQAFGGIEWMFTMPAAEVNATYEWWLAMVWTPGDPPK